MYLLMYVSFISAKSYSKSDVRRRFFILPLNIIRLFTIYYRKMGSNHSSYFLIIEYLVCYAVYFPYVNSEKGGEI